MRQGGVTARQETGPDKSGEVQVAGLGTLIQPAVRKGGEVIGKALDRTSGGVVTKGRKRSEVIKEALEKDQTKVDTGTGTGTGTDTGKDNALPTNQPPPATKPVDGVELDNNPIDQASQGTTATPTPKKVTPLTQEADQYEPYIKITDEEGKLIMTAPERRDELIGSGLSDFNANKMPDEKGVLERTQQISELYADKIDETKRGVITLQATRQMADLIGSSPAKARAIMEALLARRAGEGLQVKGLGMAESMLAAKDIVVSEMRKLDVLSTAAETGDEKALLQFAYQNELVSNLMRQYKGAQTEYARVTSSFRIEARPATGDAEIDANLLALEGRDMTKLLETYGGADALRQAAAAYNKLDHPHQRAAMARGVSKWKRWADAGYEVWHHFLLTNPITQTKNLVGGLITAFVMPNLEMAGGALVGTARRAMGASSNDVITWGDLNAQMFGQLMSLQEAFISAGKTFYTMKDQIGGSKFDDQRMMTQPFSAAGLGIDPASHSVGAVTADMMGSIMTLGRVSYRTLMGGDALFKTIAQRGEMYKQAFQTGRVRGLDGEKLADYIAEFVADPPAAALNKMEAVAKYGTLQQDLDTFGKNIKGVASNAFFRWAIPFVKTPYNAAKYTFVERTPLGILWGETGAMMRAGGRQRDEAMARVAFGTSIGMTAGSLVATGQISGGGPVNKAQRDALRMQGWQPYSIKVAGHWVSYQGIEPLSSILGAWADASEILIAITDDDDEVDTDQIIGAALGATLYNLTNKTFLEGFGRLVQMASDPRTKGPKAVQDYISSIVPRAVDYATRMSDPVIRDAEGILENFKKQIPGLSDTLNPRVDLLGNDISRGVQYGRNQTNLAYGPDALSPFYLSKENQDPLVAELVRIGGIPTSNFDRDLNVPGLEKAIKLPDKDRYWLQKRTGVLGKQVMEAVLNDPKWKDVIKFSKAGNEEATDLLRQKLAAAYRKAKDAAKLELIQRSKGLQNFIEIMADEQTKRNEALAEGMLNQGMTQ